MCDLQGIDGEDGHGRVDTEALQTRQEGVRADKEGDHICECGHRDSYAGVLHGLPKPGKEKCVNNCIELAKYPPS